MVVVALQAPTVPSTLYIVVCGGVAVTVVPVVALSVDPGDHW